MILDSFDDNLSLEAGQWCVRDPALATLLANWTGKLLITCRRPFALGVCGRCRADPGPHAAEPGADRPRPGSRRVSAGAIVACDRAMCSALVQHGIAAGNLLVLGSGTGDPLSADVVVATAAVRGTFGRRLTSVYAPEMLASFGTGSARIDIRVVASDGAPGYRSALAADVRARQVAGGELVGDLRIGLTPAVQAQLAAGQLARSRATSRCRRILPQRIRINFANCPHK